jgi:primase-polymerase (primpol)-like protein
MRGRRQWMLAAPDRHGKFKRPVSVLNGLLVGGSVVDPSTWLNFPDACLWARHCGLGIGFVCAATDGFTVIDLDVKNRFNAPGEPDKWTSQQVLDGYWRCVLSMDSYTERSISGQGLHIWVGGKIGRGVRREGVELYSQEHFIVMTGDVVLERPIADREAAVFRLAASMRAAQGIARAALVEREPTRTDEQLWHYLRGWHNGWKFDALFSGRWEDLGYPSQSEADLALMDFLCMASPSNEQCRRMFQYSALGQREKAERADYVDGLIATARGRHEARSEVSRRMTESNKENIEAAKAAYFASNGGPV